MYYKKGIPVRSDGYFRFFPGDYIKDTLELTMTEDGAYCRLLFYYYSKGRLPADREALYNIARTRNDEERAAVDKVVKLFLTVVDDRLVQGRVERELAARRLFRESQSRKGKRSVEKKREKKLLESGSNLTGVRTGA